MARRDRPVIRAKWHSLHRAKGVVGRCNVHCSERYVAVHVVMHGSRRCTHVGVVVRYAPAFSMLANIFWFTLCFCANNVCNNEGRDSRLMQQPNANHYCCCCQALMMILQDANHKNHVLAPPPANTNAQVLCSMCRCLDPPRT